MTKLDLRCNKLDDKSMKKLIPVLQHVQELNLAENEITSLGATYLTNGLKNNDQV